MKIPQRFLLIDDDPFNNRLCTMALNKTFESPDVIAFTVPETAIEYIEDEYSKHPVKTVLFLDINMPSLSGWDVLDKLKDSSNNVKDNFTIFILSSSIDPMDKQQAADNPMVTGYLEKPLTKERLQPIFNDQD